MFLIFFFLDLNYLLLAITHFQCDSSSAMVVAVQKAGGICGILAAITAWYNAFAGVFDQSNGFFTVPLGHFPWSPVHHVHHANKYKEVWEVMCEEISLEKYEPPMVSTYHEWKVEITCCWLELGFKLFKIDSGSISLRVAYCRSMPTFAHIWALPWPQVPDTTTWKCSGHSTPWWIILLVPSIHWDENSLHYTRCWSREEGNAMEFQHQTCAGISQA